MQEIRFAIIGFGNMGIPEAKMFFDGEVIGAQLTAVCDNNPEKLNMARRIFGDKVAYFERTIDLFEAGICDAVHIATPHYDHPTIAIEAFRYNLHVLIEKPAGVYTKAVRAMNEAYEVAKEKGKLFGIMYNQRTHPIYQKVRQLIAEGELGEIRGINWMD